MNNKKQVDIIRNSGGSVKIGSEKEGSIKDIFEFEGKLFVIKEKAIYEFVHADKIDPDRNNATLPNGIQRLIINQGSESEMVSRTFLTAKKLLKAEFFPDTINIRKTLSLALELLQELNILDKEIQNYLKIEEKVFLDCKEQSKIKSSFSIPSISSVTTRCKTIFQKADHIEQILMEINALFYPKLGLNKQSHFPKLYDILKTKYGEDDNFSKFISESLFFLELIRGFRNCLDHRLSHVKVYDFELLANSNLLRPSIEIDYKDVKLERESLTSFLPILTQNLIVIVENNIAFLSDKNTKTNGLPRIVKLIPEELRSNKYVKFGFWSPLGKQGFFHQ